MNKCFAMLYATISYLGHVRRDSLFTVMTSGKVRIPERFQSRVAVVPKSAAGVLRGILNSEVVIFTGGTSIHDHRGNMRYLRVMVQILGVLAVARVLHKPNYLLGIGIGPLSTWWGRGLARCVLRMSDFVSVRDDTSYSIAGTLVPTARLVRAFDLAALLLCEPGLQPSRSSERNVLGVSVLPYYAIYHRDPQRDALWVKRMAAAFDRWLASDCRNRLRVFIIKGPSGEDDVEISHTLVSQLVNRDRAELVEYDPNPLETLRKVGECDGFVGMRLHACIFAYLANVPFIMLDYHPKCRSVADALCLPWRAISRLEELDDIEERVVELMASPGRYVARLPRGEAVAQAQLNFSWINDYP